MTRSTPADRRRRSRMALGAVAMLVCSLVAGTVRAQQVDPQATTPGSRRPFQALFGGFEGNPASNQSFDVSLSLSGNSNDSMTPLAVARSQRDGGSDPWFSGSMFYSGAGAVLAYNRRWTRARFSASSGHGVYYYPGSGNFMDAAHSLDVSFGAVLSERISVRAAQAVSYSPFYGLGMFPGHEAETTITWSPLYSVSAQKNVQLTSSAELTARITRKLSFSTGYDRQQLQFTESRRSFVGQTAGGRFDFRLSRDLTVRAGYKERMGDYGTLFVNGVTVNQHDIDAGVDFNRALSVSRRARVGFSTGSTIYTTALKTYYRLLADARLDVALGRSWASRVQFLHGMQWVQGFPEPIFGDVLQAGVSGYATDRVLLRFDAGYSRGEPGLSSTVGARLETYTGRAQVRVALSRFAALSANYFYYHYTFGAGFPMPSGMARTFDRQTVRGGVDLWLPLLR